MMVQKIISNQDLDVWTTLVNIELSNGWRIIDNSIRISTSVAGISTSGHGWSSHSDAFVVAVEKDIKDEN